jgi:hypothetical protein
VAGGAIHHALAASPEGCNPRPALRVAPTTNATLPGQAASRGLTYHERRDGAGE